MTTLDGRGLDFMLKAQQQGKIITQFLGTAPATDAGMVGSIALDSKDGASYYKTSTGWVAF